MYCPHCGKQIPDNIKFCPKCGKSLAGINSSSSEHSIAKYGPASPGMRLLNYILDRVIIIIFVVIVAGVGSLVLKDEALTVIVFFAFFIGYDLFFEGIWQRTPAKWLTKTKVVSVDGSKPGFWRILGRTLARYIPFEPFSFLAGPVGWHDSLSHTLVVPSNYGPGEIKQIDTNNTNSSKLSTPIIILICFFVGIVVIGLLASVVLLALNSAREKSRDAKRVADVRQMASALELFYNDFGRYPHAIAEISPKYIDTLPEAPTPSDGTCTAEQNKYSYFYISDAEYKLSYCLGANTANIPAGVQYMTPSGNGNALPLNTNTSVSNSDIEVTNTTQTPILSDVPKATSEDTKVVMSWLDSSLDGWVYDEGKPYKVSMTFKSVNDPSFSFTATSSSSIYGNPNYSVGGGCGGTCYQNGSFLWSIRNDAAKSVSDKGVLNPTVVGFQFSASGFANMQPDVPKDDYRLVSATFNGKPFSIAKDAFTKVFRVCAYGHDNYYECYY